MPKRKGLVRHLKQFDVKRSKISDPDAETSTILTSLNISETNAIDNKIGSDITSNDDTEKCVPVVQRETTSDPAIPTTSFHMEF